VRSKYVDSIFEAHARHVYLAGPLASTEQYWREVSSVCFMYAFPVLSASVVMRMRDVFGWVEAVGAEKL